MIIVDTGPLVALLHADDRQHERCLNWYDTARGPLIVPQTVAVEVAYFVAQRCGPAVEADFVRSLGPDGPFELAALRPTDMARVAELVEQYADFPLGTVDASVIALAERLNITTVATLDVRHFAAVRPRHVDAFTLQPA
ncbi:type II toxin-antitoxin system VapC family toxin [Luedemannella helvata]|uniref:Ribonuclease VapC n=1 Tax=Luedemannella helvata TaxID=349315 RepID=A0ABP4X0Y7_9ACTN